MMPSISTVEDNKNQVPSDLSLDQNQESSSGIPAMRNNQSKYDNSVKTQTSFEEIILGFIKRDQVTTKKPRKRVCLGAEVITRKDVTRFQNTQVTKKIKPKKDIQKKKRDISSDKSEVESWKSDVSSDRITEFDDLSESPTDEETNSVVRCTNNANSNPPNRKNKESIDSEQDQVLSIQNGYFVLAYFFGKKKTYKYVCLVTEISDDEAEVTCLRKLRNASEYRLDESDECSILLWDIIEKLPQPKLLPHADDKFLSKNETYCVCVPYHLCKEAAYNTFGDGLMDIRFQENPCPMPGEICCMLKSNPKSNNSYFQNVAKCGYSSEVELKSAQAFLGNTTDDTVTTFGEYPWTAIVYANFQYICTGSLIHPMVILTSAMCVQNKTYQYVVRMGEWDRTHIKEPFGYENRKVTSLYIHPKYYQKTLSYNAALLIVDFPFILQPNIKTICLIDESKNGLSHFYNKCVATGWGKNVPTGRFRKKMKKIKFSLVKRKLCQSQLQNSELGMSYLLHKTVLCGVNEQHYDICIGDYGGPLVCPISDQPLRFQQIGITSWNVDCFANYPTLFTKVSNIRDWIDGEFENLELDTKYYTHN
ncbi:hypothetical protein RN001_006705 [Aquatica leii]|uniref:Peptidase S1 domain-containing protein n=1 Tax=Aquatica leii TaxID=1421715 RepID=A0AAN7PLE5_9COLE|nr:hypothetical protein RN001_006705 [Aquatica leii]